ncbi:MAG: archease, partial [Candidatus Micrarchaeota archaeon]
ELVVNFLSSILAECEIHELLPCRVEIEGLKKNFIKAKIYGKKERPEDHIKAVTYHRFKIGKKEGLVFIEVIFDV